MAEDIDEKVIYSVSGVESSAYELGDGEFTVAVIGKNHGDEQGPREVFDEIFRDLPEAYDDLSLSYIPEANAFAHRETSRKTPRDFQPNAADEHDLNRCYETARQELEGEGETQRLNTTQQAAFRVLEYLEELQPDLVVDMHSGTSGTSKMPQIRYKHREDYPVEEDAMRGVTENAGVDIVSSKPDSGAEMLGAVAPKMGHLAVTVEVGGGVEYGREGVFEDSEAENYHDILMNIFEYALRGEETDFSFREFSGIEKNFTPMDVSGEVEYHFGLGDEVLRGETVATVRDGDEIHELKALSDGVLETVLTQVRMEDVKPGNRVFNLAERE